MSARENYANQESGDYTQPASEMTQELYRQWQHARRIGVMCEETARALIAKAHAGSWMAGNMLHLSEVMWDKVVGTEPYEYREAVYHGDRYSVGVCSIYDQGRPIDES